MTEQTNSEFGRADENGNVYVSRAGEEVLVGQYPDATPAEALAFFTRKFTDLAAQITLLEQRLIRGADARALRQGLASVKQSLSITSGVGDYATLEQRVATLDTKLDDVSKKQEQVNAEAVHKAIADRTALVEAAEQLAAGDPAKTQWKRASVELDELFTRWKEHQKSEPRIPRAAADELWARFKAARSTIETNRRAFFAQLDAQHKESREQKRRLIAEAEALSIDSPGSLNAYRALLDRWKSAGRTSAKQDDALWAQFKAAGDALYSARKAERAREDEEGAENLEKKRALLAEAQKLLPVTDQHAARKALTGIQIKWDELGRVPRANVREVEDGIRAVERAVAAAEREHWESSDPSTKERVDDLSSQLSAAIAELEQDVATARAAGDEKTLAEAEAALAARREWLSAITH